MADIIPLREPRYVRVRRAFDEWYEASDHWSEKTIALAIELVAVRTECGENDTAFGVWLVEHNCDDLGRQARAALINMGRHIDLTRETFRTAKRRSVEYIWEEEIKPQLERLSARIEEPTQDLYARSYTSPDSDQTIQAASRLESPQRTYPEESQSESNPSYPCGADRSLDSDQRPIMRIGAQASEEAHTEGLAKTAESGTAERVPLQPKISSHHPFVGRPRAAEVAALYENGRTRTTISQLLRKKRGSRDVWNLILESMDAGFLRQNSIAVTLPTAKLLFPQAPTSFTRLYSLAEEKDRKVLREQILPAAIRCRGQILVTPEQIAEILQRDAAAIRERARLEEQERKLNSARKTLAAHEPEVILFGKHFWPIVDIDNPDQRYDYAQLTAAAWFFDDALRLARASNDNSPKSCGLKIRFLIKRLGQFNDTLPLDQPARGRWRRIFELVNEMTRMLERSPEKEISNRLPLLPLEKSYD
jgi:hypothetical protein